MRPAGPGTIAAVGGVVVLATLLPASLAALQREVWVVNETSQDVSIIDDPNDVPATIDTISLLGGAGSPQPYGLAFSTFATAPGSHAFVSQGADIRVIDADTRMIVSTVDVATLIGRPGVVLKGMDAARPDLFEDDSGTLQMRYLLHVAADVRPAAGAPFQPWFIVLDQAVLAGLSTGSALVADGPLVASPGSALEAMEVRVLGAPAGDAVQRAWYSWRDNADPPAIGASRVVGDVSSSWRVDAEFVNPLESADVVPESIHPGAPHSRELPLLPLGPAGTLRHLDSPKTCPFDDVPRAVSVTGPGLASFDLWVAIVDPLGPDRVELSNWETCTLQASVNVGEDPVDMDTRGRVEWQQLYVASRSSDSVSIIDASDPTTAATVALSALPTPPCTKCPRSIAVRESAETVCRAVRLEAQRLEPLEDVSYTWDGLGCQEQTSFKVWCRCLAPTYDECPADCVANCPTGALQRQTGEVWCEVDVVASDGGDDGGSKTVMGSGQSKTQVTAETDDDTEP